MGGTSAGLTAGWGGDSVRLVKKLILPLLLLALYDAHAQPSFSGAYRGRLSNGAEIVLVSAGGAAGALYVVNYATRSLELATLNVASDGAYNSITPSGIQARGRFTTTGATLTYGNLAAAAPTRVPLYGPTQQVAGGYFGFLNDQVTKTVESLTVIATNQGEVFLMAIRGSSYDAGLGVIDAAGNFSVPTVAGGRYSGRLNAVNGAVTGNMSIAGYGLVPFSLVQGRTAVLQNVSTRGFVGSGDSIMIVGFVVADSAKAVIVRALGPTLTQFGVSGVLADPQIEIFDAAGRVIGANDNWGAAEAATRIPAASGLTNIDARDAGLVLNLDPGSYTVVVRGAGGGTGNAIVEVYEVR